MQSPAAPVPVHIEWIDAVHRYGWHEGHTPERGVSRVKTLGYLLVEDEDGVVVTQSVGVDSHAQTIEIPRGMIVSMCEVAVAPVRVYPLPVTSARAPIIEELAA